MNFPTLLGTTCTTGGCHLRHRAKIRAVRKADMSHRKEHFYSRMIINGLIEVKRCEFWNASEEVVL